MKKLSYFLLALVFVCLQAGAQLAGAYQDGDRTPPEPVTVQEEPSDDYPSAPSIIPPLVGGAKADRPMVFIDKPLTESRESVTEATITLWYGPEQYFGQIGIPQQWINILGNVSAPEGTEITSLTYRIKNGPEMPLSIGKDNRRLANPGDFNIEIDYEDLSQGTTKVTVTAMDSDGGQTSEAVDIIFEEGNTWPESYDTDWANVNPSRGIQDQAQIVDGKWTIQNGKLKVVEAGYDRLADIGDMGDPGTAQNPARVWTDYEVTVPIKVTGLDESGFEGVSNGPGIGLILRWLGHNAKNGGNPEQPLVGVDNVGGLGWYRWSEPDGAEGLDLLDNAGGNFHRIGASSAKVWEFDVTYIMKMSVQSLPDPYADSRAYYRLKFWEQGEPEPAQWDIEGLSKTGNTPSGSVLLVAHHTYAEFGDVEIRPLDELTYTLDAGTTGNGSITVNPQPAGGVYTYGQKVNITATPDPGYYLESWTGDFPESGIENILSFNMTMDTEVTANFAPAVPGKLTVNVDGQGTVSKVPDKAQYDGGEVVTLTASPAAGYAFQNWSGDLTGTSNPGKIQIVGDRNVTAKFLELSALSPQSDDFSQCALDTNVWTFIDPTGDGTYALKDAKLELGVSGGAAHTMWREDMDAPRIMQETEDHNFAADLKFESIPTQALQIQGFIVEEDSENWLRFDIHHDGSDLKMFAGGYIDGKAESYSNKIINIGGADVVYMRVTRVNDTWTQEYSADGQNWQQPSGSFVEELAVASTGVFVGNQPDGSAPAFVSKVDYFMNTAFPIDPEDGSSGSVLNTAVVGEGDIGQDPLPNVQGKYPCGQEVTLTAQPANGWSFSSWSGAAQGSANPIQITMDENKNVTATFSQGAAQIQSFLPSVISQ